MCQRPSKQEARMLIITSKLEALEHTEQQQAVAIEAVSTT